MTANSHHHSTKAIINEITAFAKNQLPAKQATLISRFIKLYYAHTSAEDLLEHTPQDLYGAAFSHWELMQQKQPNELRLKVFNPHLEQHGWQSTHTIVQLAISDMPFLVDSMCMEVNRLGLSTHLMIYMGGMKIKRDEQNRIIDVLPHYAKCKGAKIESPICLEVDRRTDPEFLASLKNNITRVVNDVRVANEDWKKMTNRIHETIDMLSQKPVHVDRETVDESIAFLSWLLIDHFTFLGMRDYAMEGKGKNQALRLIPGSGLGVLRDEKGSKMVRLFADLPEQARDLVCSKDHILLISKTNTRSTIHRPETFTDYISVNRYDDKGNIIGERRIIGLYTSAAYTGAIKSIPIVRRKVEGVLKKSRLPVKSHAGKDLLYILTNLPKDDVFQASTEEIYRMAMGILHLQERRRIRLFAREDIYGRFISCLIYLPRDNFNTALIKRAEVLLLESFGGLEASFTTRFFASVLARIHFVIRIDPQNRRKYNLKEVEKQLIEIGKSWVDELKEGVADYFGEERGNVLAARYRNAFPAGYREVFAARNAVFDIEHMENLTLNDRLGMSFYRPLGATKEMIRFKLFHMGSTVPLSDALPMLENMGLRVIGEQPYEIVPDEGMPVWINDFGMVYNKDQQIDVEEIKAIFQDAFKNIWLGNAESDTFNRLVLVSKLSWREISILRAYAKYFRQTGFTYSIQYIAETLVNNPKAAHTIVELFHCHFDPSGPHDVKEQLDRLETTIIKILDEVTSLDEDRILRRYVEVIHATLRTNFFQKNAQGKAKAYISFKFDPRKLPELPLPLPRYETFVYSPRFEGVHLRAAKVARGGIRWSDRREDFRSEVLGLMKAQQVKNALIVPAGAKGGFVPKNLPQDGSREEIIKEGIACYQDFIRGLLDLIDNLQGEKVIQPADTVCYDDDDTYFVVAADKGTATFSDIANSIALERGYWLGDAFASGGSTGYDHKKMGITARGAWVSAERHFQELGINVDDTEITVAGVGDMSGDVFGNGMLMSEHIKLLFAFNHMHIFIDPNPDPAISFLERKRLFETPRSTWEDYNKDLISQGGGIYKRTIKAIKISPEIKELLNINKDVLRPSELIKAVLRAPVDLIWNGGVGTFVKASTESNNDVADRANDTIRVNANELNAKVICEGGNLGLTQLARIEYELFGGKINTDFIDNSAGVDCSDHEVNIKILLNNIVASGDMTEKQRNALLSKMTTEVAELVLQNNYHQNQAISMASFLSPAHVSLYMNYIDYYEKEGKVNRDLEFLPDNKTLLERKSVGLGLTRPEIAVLFAYSKIILEDSIRKSDLLDEPYIAQFIKNAFPTPLRKRYGNLLNKHHLSREIVSTQLSNQIVSDMGVTFAYQMYDETGASIPQIVRAYAAAHHVFHMAELFADIESLDYKVDATVQHRMTDEVVRLVRRVTRWLLRNRRTNINLEQTILQFEKHIIELFRRLPKLLLGDDRERYEERRDALIAANVTTDIATKVASAAPMFHAMNIVEASILQNTDVYQVAKIYFMIADRLNLFWFRDQINFYSVENRWSVLAKSSCKGDLDWIQRELAIGVLKMNVSVKSINARLNAWISERRDLIDRWEEVLIDLRSGETKDFAILSVAIRELSDLAQMDTNNKMIEPLDVVEVSNPH